MRLPPASTTELAVLARRPGRYPGESRVIVGADAGALRPIAQALGPGGSIMVGYGGDETERALRRRVPPAATPLGIALLRAGCRWLKDWYFAEGGREGATKLQGELPRDDAQRRRQERALRAELEAFLAGTPALDADRARARESFEMLGAPDG